jgi:hypothetical protein
MSQVNTLTSQISAELAEKYELLFMTIGDKAKYQPFKEFSANVSNHSLAFEKINSDYYNRNVGAVLFVSDGNYNKGTNPIYPAEKLNFTPVFTLGIGDTIPKRDQLIKHVNANEVVFYRNKFPIEIDVEGFKMGNASATVSVVHNGRTIATKPIKYTNGKYDFKQVVIEVDANKIGIQSYTIQLNRANNEFNYENNSKTIYVEVVDSRNKVLCLTGAPHPDVAAIKEVLSRDENCEVTTETVKTWNRKIEGVDLVVWHEPGIFFDPSIQDLLLSKKIPVWYIIGPNTSAQLINKLDIGLMSSGGNQSDEVQGAWKDGFTLFELSERTKQAIAFYPPLQSRFGEVRLNGSNEVAMSQRVGPVRKKDPLLFFGTRNNSRFSVLYGEGIWRWKMNDFTRTGNIDAFAELIQKSAQYLLVKQPNSPFRVNGEKRYTKDEEVIFDAALYNSSMEQVNTAEVEFELTDEKGKKAKNTFAKSGSAYKLSLGKLPPGKYTWKAKTTLNNKSFVKNGFFIVEDVKLESLDNCARHQQLRQLSQITGGLFMQLKASQKMIDVLKNRQDITTVSVKESSYNDLIDYKLLFMLIALFLIVEWFLRRWLGSY